MATIERLDAIAGRLEGITPGHWVAAIDIEPIDGRYWDGSNVYAVDELPVPDYGPDGTEEDSRRVSAWEDAHCRGAVAETHNYFSIPDEQHDANQRLIGHAPDDLRYLLGVARAAEALLAWSGAAQFYEANGELWRALQDALGEKEGGGESDG